MKYQMRIYFEVLGGHTHVKIFVGRFGGTLGCAGDITLTNEEFQAWRNAQIVSEFIEKRADVK